MDKIQKFLKKLPSKQYLMAIEVIEKILQGDIVKLDVKNLQGYQNVFRVRKGKLRILFKLKGGKYTILNIDYRSEDNYRNI